MSVNRKSSTHDSASRADYQKAWPRTCHGENPRTQEKSNIPIESGKQLQTPEMVDDFVAVSQPKSKAFRSNLCNSSSRLIISHASNP
mmetsp:Transcript_39731/g.158073  ORF Transcript_39731/g.158073 Transcript_39731/m.158073 type:complete len:87 (-) Transcript_39731:4181-4441(-)